MGSKVETSVGSARMRTRFFGVFCVAVDGKTREGIRVGFEDIVVEVGLPNTEGDC